MRGLTRYHHWQMSTTRDQETGTGGAQPSQAVRLSTPRTDVRATLPDGRVFEAPVGTTLQQLMAVALAPQGAPIVAAMNNGRLNELTTPLTQDGLVAPITASDEPGARIFRRALCFLMVTAASELFPEAALIVEHSVPGLGGYYCEPKGRLPFSEAELERLHQRMLDAVRADEPITKLVVPVGEATSLFRNRGENDKASLLTHTGVSSLPLYELRGRRDCFHGEMVPSAGCLRPFALLNRPPGFILQFPHQSRPTEIEKLAPYPKLFAVFERASYLMERLGIRNVGALNEAIVGGRFPEVSLVSEAMHEAAVAEIAREIASRTGHPIKLVLVAGPSASGKTTFSKRLAVQLMARGLRPFAVALDDYFVDRELTPRDFKGDHDFEALEAIDVALFNEHLLSLSCCKPTELPRYSFAEGRRERGRTVRLNDDSVIIIEGIHGLNPALVRDLPGDSVYRVYVSLLTQLNLDRHSRISTSDCRLIRRVVRDAATRGYNATQSLRRWLSVARGEKQFIFPFQENSDAVFDSSLVYELAVLRTYAEPLLLQVQAESPEYEEARRLLALLQWFRPARTDAVPNNSLLREFIGGSTLRELNLLVDVSPAGQTAERPEPYTS